jgi:Type II secretion system (T2SS), protein M subtype b
MTLQTRDRRALMVLAPVLLLALILWLSSSPSSRGTVKIAEPVDSVDKAEKRLAILKKAAATLGGREAVLKEASLELASREKGLIPGDTAEQAQAQLLQALKRVGREQAPPLDIRQVELAQPSGYGDAYGRVTVSVTIDCRIDEMVNYLATLSAQPEITATDEIRFGTSHPKQKNMPVRLTVSGIVARRLIPEKTLKKGPADF